MNCLKKANQINEIQKMLNDSMQRISDLRNDINNNHDQISDLDAVKKILNANVSTTFFFRGRRFYRACFIWIL